MQAHLRGGDEGLGGQGLLRGLPDSSGAMSSSQRIFLRCLRLSSCFLELSQSAVSEEKLKLSRLEEWE